MSLPRKVLNVNGHSWAYLDFGEGEIIVLLHGIMSNADYLVPIANSLSLKFRVIIVDLPGFGFTASLKKNNCKSITFELINFLKELRISKANFFGASMGGAILLELAITRPNLIKNLFLQSPPWERGSVKLALYERVELLLINLPSSVFNFIKKPKFFNIIVKIVTKLKPGVAKIFEEHRTAILRDVSTMEIEAIRELTTSILDPDFTKKLLKLKVHPIFISGLKDEVVEPQEMKKLSETVPHSHCVFVDKQDHEIIVDAPDKVAKIIWTWISQKRQIDDPDFTWISH